MATQLGVIRNYAVANLEAHHLRAHGSDDANGLVAGDEGELGNELSLMDVLAHEGLVVDLPNPMSRTVQTVPDLCQECQLGSVSLTQGPPEGVYTCSTDTASLHLNQNIVFTKLWQWNRNNRELLGLGVPEELGQPGSSTARKRQEMFGR